MNAKLKPLKDGMLADITTEKIRATPVGHFALVEKAITSHPRSLLDQLVPTPAFSAENAAATNASKRRVIKIPPERLQENPLNARRIYDPQIVQERATSIATHGQQTPGLAAPDPVRPGWYVLIDDHHRKRALAAVGKSEMDCFVEDGLPDIDFHRLSFVLSEQCSGQSVLGNATAWHQLLDEGKVEKEKDIRGITGISTGMANKTLALLRLPESVSKVMKERPVGIGIVTGYEPTLYFKAAGGGRTREPTHRVLEEELSSRDVEQTRKAAQGGRTRRVKEVSRQCKIRGAEGNLLGIIREWDSGRVMLDVKLVDHGARESLVEALKNRFGLDVALL